MSALLELETKDMQLWQAPAFGKEGMTLAMPPKVVDWNKPAGRFEQEIGKTKISYLSGARKDKSGSGDVGVAYIYSSGNWQMTATLTEDYLSRPNGVDDGWDKATEILKKQLGRSKEYVPFVDVDEVVRIERSEPIGWSEFPDVAGAELSRILAIASLSEVVSHIGNRIDSLDRQLGVALTPVELNSDGMSFPVLEKASILMLQSILKTRNMWRWGALDAAINNPSSDWKNYWMNAAICASLTLSYCGEGDDDEVKVAFAWARSLADVQLKFDSMVGHGKPFVDADVNAVFDRYAASKDETGLTDPRVYTDKTSDRGLYMTWGNPFGDGRFWLERAWPRADTGSLSFETDSRILQTSSMTDGLYNFSRNPVRRRNIDETLDWRLSGYENYYHPGAVLNLLSLQPEFPTDDYFFLQITQEVARRSG